MIKLKYCNLLIISAMVVAFISCSPNGEFSEQKVTKRPIGYRCVDIGEMINPNIFRMPCRIMKWESKDYFIDSNDINMCKAIEYEKYSEIERLLASGVDINMRGKGNMTFLFWGLPAGKEMFDFLLEHGANPNTLFEHDIIPNDLMFYGSVAACVMTLPEDYLKSILKYGCNPDLENYENKKTLIFYVALNENQETVKNKLKILKDAGADINHRDINGQTILLDSFLHSPLIFLESGVDYRIPDFYGKTILERIVSDSERLKNNHKLYNSSLKPIIDFFKPRNIDLSLNGKDYILIKSIIFNEKKEESLLYPKKIGDIARKRRQQLSKYYTERFGNNYTKWLAN
jgi:ankyrin repeat protein